MQDLPAAFLQVPIAHRALHDLADARPENSRAAVRAAIEAGYGIEIDVQRSRDNQAIVFHDYDLDRLTAQTGPVSDYTAEQLAHCPLLGGHDGIPALTDVLQLVAGAVPLLIEIKDQDGAMGPVVGPLEHAVAQALAGYSGPVAVMSFNPHAVRKMAQLAPQVPRGLVTSAFNVRHWSLPATRRAQLRQIPDYDALKCCFISHDRRDLDRPRVAELKRAGAHVLCWTVTSPAEEAQARKIADNITFEQYPAPFPA